MQMKTARLLLCAAAFAPAISAEGRGGLAQERKVVNFSPTRGLPFNDVIVFNSACIEISVIAAKQN